MSSGRSRRQVAPSRALRATAVGAWATAIATVGHVTGGGSWPAPSMVVPIVAVGALGGLALARATWTVARLFVGLAALQVAVHVVMWLGSGPSSVDPRLAPLAHQHGGSMVHEHMTVMMSPHMLAGHAVAVLATAVALVSVDRALVLLAAVARRLFPLWTTLVIPSAGASPSWWAPRRATIARSQHLVVVRGNAPPVSISLI